MPRVYWTPEERQRLVGMAGRATRQQLEAALPGKTWQAILSKARRLGFQVFQGSWTLTRLMEETGYNWKQLGKARDALGQVWATSGAPRSAKRGGHRPRFVVTDEQAEELFAYLASATKKHWGASRDGKTFWESCQKCGATGGAPSKEHDYGGVCVSCRNRESRQRQRCPECGATPLTLTVMIRKHRRREYGREWARKQRSNPDYLAREAKARRGWRARKAAEVGGGGVLVQLGSGAVPADGGLRGSESGDPQRPRVAVG